MSLSSLYGAPVPPDFLRDESRKTGAAEAIAFPRNLAELTAAVRESAAQGKALTVQGARTGISAGGVPDGGFVLSLSKMNHVLECSASRSAPRLRAEAGLTLAELRRVLAAAPGRSSPSALFFPPDPTETSASLGGMAACNSSGACSYAYGPTRNHIEALTVVLADGDTLSLRRGEARAQDDVFALTTTEGRVITGRLPRLDMPSVKNAAGYWIKPGMDLIDLFIGSEGTLGIVAELELRLRPKPFASWGIVCYFERDDQALAFVDTLRKQAGSIHPHRLIAIEYFDAGALRMIRESTPHTGLILPEPKPHWNVALYLEWTLPHEDTRPVELTVSLLADCGGHADDTWIATDAPALDKMKAFRHAVPERVNAIIAERKRAYPELTKLGTDLSVPDDRLRDIMNLYRRDLTAVSLEHVIFGHIGNNHVHVNILPRNMDEYATGKSLYREWAERVVAWGGSVSAEHGVGRLKKELLAVMYGPEQINGMRQLKALFDPGFRLNPGRLFEVR